MAADVFISHSSKDIKVAETICSALESRGTTCWISSRDVDAGENFAEAIVDAIAAAKIMLLVFSANANNSGEIKKELVVASHSNTVVIPVRVEDVVPSGAMRYELATRQWIDLFADWEREVDRLARRIQAIIKARVAGADVGTMEAAATAAAPTKPAEHAATAQPLSAFHAAEADAVVEPLARPSERAEWPPSGPSRLLPLDPPAAGHGFAVTRSRPSLARRAIILLAAAVGVAGTVIGAIILMRPAAKPIPIADTPARIVAGPGKGETVGYVAGLDPYGDNYLSLRTGPGTEFPEIYRMGENTFVVVITIAGKWTQIRLNGGQTGWAYSQYLRPGYPH